MDMPDEISKLHAQLEEAEADLEQSLTEVNHKVEAVDLRLRAEKAIKRNPLAFAGLAAAAGFALGTRFSRGSVIGALALGVILGIGFRANADVEQDE